MTKFRLAAVFAVAGLMTVNSAIADDFDSELPFTMAVFGDWPYGDFLFNNANRLVDSINGDRDVSLVLHVGDIHSGSQPCTSAGILPAISTANPGYNQAIYFQFQQLKFPVVYTPGDNEWTDCHKTKEKSSGAPLKELESVRSLFFARPGHTLGLRDMEVVSQAQHFDDAHPEDAQYVENVMWKQHRVVFATFNMPGGSNNDDYITAQWTAPFTDDAAQSAEATERTAADTRWLETVFAQAMDPRVKAVVLGLQADMWDPEAALDGYTSFVQRLADLSVQFGRPVLLINGDSHLFLTDHPLADPSSTTGLIHHTQPVPNLTRIVVQGSTNDPAEWLKLTIDPRKNQPFSWANVVYCSDPENNTCQ